MYHFQHIEYLIGLAAIPLLIFLCWMVIRWKKNTVKKIGDPPLVIELIKGHSPVKFLIKCLLAVCGLATLVLAMANLQKPGIMENVNRQGVDIVIAMDVSNSMLAEDIKPNRLEKAKQFLYKLMDQLKNDRVGLVWFAGRAYTQMPLTTDQGMARMYIQNANPDIVPAQGTMISEALRISNAAFNSKERKFKAVVLITDGEDHDPATAEAAKELTANGVMINTVGIGSPDGSPIIDRTTNEPKKDPLGNTVISKLNESGLQQLAQTSKGVYVHLDDVNEAVKTITQQLDTIEKTSLEDKAFKDYKSYFQWFLAAALLLILAEFFIPERKWSVT